VRIEMRLLGSVQTLVAGRVVDIAPPKVRALLTLLALNANQAVPRSRLIDELWGDEPPAAAVNLVQGYVSDLRKVLGADALATRGQSYALALERGALDVTRFEELVARGRERFELGRAAEARDTLDQAVQLWRGTPLADLAEEPFAAPIIARLNEVRLLATELRVEAELELGRHAEVIPDLEELARHHPFNERVRELLMIALYRARRQADALAVFRDGRERMIRVLGIEPTPALRQLERRILRHEQSLDQREARERGRTILAATSGVAPDAVLSVGARLAVRALDELIALWLVRDASELSFAGAELERRRAELVARGVAARAAPVVTEATATDVIRFATEQDVDLVLLGAAPEARDPVVREVLGRAACDVALVSGLAVRVDRAAVLVLFGGGANDWAALEVGAWLADALNAPLRVAGPGPRAGRLLANASIAVQRTLGIAAEPVVLAADAPAAAAAAAAAGVAVVGLPDEWRSRALGPIRLAALAAAQTGLVVRRGIRPGGVAPGETLTRYTWSLESSAS
jgi:DNA-binding SARP family transcriptional activator